MNKASILVGILFLLASAAHAVRLENPVELGSIDTPSNAKAVSLVGGLAYVADGFSGLRVILSVAVVPTEVGSIDTPGFAN